MNIDVKFRFTVSTQEDMDEYVSVLKQMLKIATEAEICESLNIENKHDKEKEPGY